MPLDNIFKKFFIEPAKTRRTKNKQKTKINKKKQNNRTKERTGKYTLKAGTTKLGRCYVEPLPNNNLKLILGRRRYKTKYLANNLMARDYINEVANDPLRKQQCIVVARSIDDEIKSYNKTYKKTQKIIK